MSDVQKSPSLEVAYAERFDRGRLLKRAAVGGAALGLAPWVATSAYGATSRTIKIGYVTPTNRPARRVRRGRRLHPQADEGAVPQGPPHRQDHLPRGDPGARLAVEHQPCRIGRAEPDPRRRHRPDARRRHPRDHQPGGGHLRGEPGAVHLVARAVAAVVLRPQGRPRRRASSGRTTSSGGSRTSSPCSWTCGARCRRTRSSAPSSRTTATAWPGATRSSASRRRSRRPATSSSIRAATRT